MISFPTSVPMRSVGASTRIFSSPLSTGPEGAAGSSFAPHCAMNAEKGRSRIIHRRPRNECISFSLHRMISQYSMGVSLVRNGRDTVDNSVIGRRFWRLGEEFAHRPRKGRGTLRQGLAVRCLLQRARRLGSWFPCPVSFRCGASPRFPARAHAFRAGRDRRCGRPLPARTRTRHR